MYAIRSYYVHQIEVIYPGDMIKFNIYALLIAFAGGFIADLICADYGFFGIMLITAIYVLKDKKIWMCVMFVIFAAVWTNTFEMIGVLGFIPIFLYNGKKGPSMKYAFYAIYPVHLLVLGAISAFLL